MNIYLLATQRSGTTLLSNTIGAHPQVFSPHPVHFYSRFHLFESKLVGKGIVLDNDKLLTHYINMIKLNPIPWNIDLYALKEEIVGRVGASPFQNSSIIHSVASRLSGKPVYFCKEVDLVKFADFLSTDHTSKFIYLHRDPREVVASFKKIRIGDKNTCIIALRWSAEQKKIIKFLQKIHPSRYKIISFSDLIEKYHIVIPEILSFIGIEMDKTIFDYYKSDESIRRASLSKNWVNTASPPDVQVLKKNRLHISIDDIAQIENIAHKEMETLGYTYSQEGAMTTHEKTIGLIRNALQDNLNQISSLNFSVSADGVHLIQQLYYVSMFTQEGIKIENIKDPATRIPLSFITKT